jgi:hypothetical protein
MLNPLFQGRGWRSSKGSAGCWDRLRGVGSPPGGRHRPKVALHRHHRRPLGDPDRGHAQIRARGSLAQRARV